MSEYKRFVSYIYAYDKGLKSKNVGFAKMEVRNGECRIQVSIKGAFSASGKELEVYLFHREQEMLLGTSMGSFAIKNGNGEFKSVTAADNIGGSGLALEEMNGLLLRHMDEEARIYASGWDDHTVIPENFIPVNQKTEVEEAKETALTTETEDLSIAELVPVMEAVEEELARLGADMNIVQAESHVEPVPHVPEIFPVTDDVPNMPQMRSAAESIPEMPQIRPAADPASNMPEIRPAVDPAPNMPEIRPAVDPAPNMPEIRPVVDPAPNMPQIHPSIEPAPEMPQVRPAVDPVPAVPEVQPMVSERSFGQTEAEERAVPAPSDKKDLHNSLWDRLENIFPKVVAFEDEPKISCLKIDLKDLEYLPRENWGLANNSFLLHGYYNFRYLILAKLGDNQYMIGVPGMYHNNERFMAAMFGFDHFKPVKDYKPLTGHFGYWYQWVRL